MTAGLGALTPDRLTASDMGNTLPEEGKSAPSPPGFSVIANGSGTLIKGSRAD
jgi:hypothetical protein